MEAKLVDFQEEFVYVRDDKPRTTSLKIAEAFGKEHHNVIRLIRKKTRNYSKSFNAINFDLVSYEDEKGERRPMYEMTKDGFAVLVLGFTGSLAAKFQEAFIEEFNRRGELIQKMKFQALPAPSRKNLHSFGYHKLEKTLDGKSKLTWVSGAKKLEDMSEIERHAWLQSRRGKSGIGHIKALIADMPDNEKYSAKVVYLLEALSDLVKKVEVKQVSPALAQRLLFEEVG